MTDIKCQVEHWLPQLEYYMEDANIPSEAAEKIAYYRCARAYLADRFVELYAMIKQIDFEGISA